jgi:hypothetical protein
VDNSGTPPDGAPTRRRIVIVAGPGRSGTSTVTGALTKFGLEVPGRPIGGNPSNPEGFFEPRWVVDFHKALLKANHVSTMDAFPGVQQRMTRVTSEPSVRETLRSWLAERLNEQPVLVVKDPRVIWFCGLWSETARELGVELGFLTMLRHPAEVSASHRAYYDEPATTKSREVELRHVAGWINVILTAEQVTAGSPRTFVRYADLLDDWRSALSKVGKDLDLELEPAMDAPDHPVDQFIDPSLRRLHGDWSRVDVPDALCDLGERVWQAMSALSRDSESATGRADVQALRAEYRQMTDDAVALSRPVIRRARASSRRQERQELLEEGYVLPTEVPRSPTAVTGAVVRRILRRPS